MSGEVVNAGNVSAMACTCKLKCYGLRGKPALVADWVAAGLRRCVPTLRPRPQRSDSHPTVPIPSPCPPFAPPTVIGDALPLYSCMQRYKICPTHCVMPGIVKDGRVLRFCQQVGGLGGLGGWMGGWWVLRFCLRVGARGAVARPFAGIDPHVPQPPLLVVRPLPAHRGL